MDMLTYAIIKRYVDKAVELGTGMTPEEVANLQSTMNQLKTDMDDTKAQIQEVSEAIGNKVDAEEGKGLSSNDFTDELLDKLNSISSTEDDDIEGVQVNGVDLPPENGVVNIPLASTGVHGVVTSSGDDNKVTILEDGTMMLNNISFSKIVQDEEDTTVIFVGGDSTTV